MAAIVRRHGYVAPIADAALARTVANATLNPKMPKAKIRTRTTSATCTSHQPAMSAGSGF
jgi:hypothetical protein